MLPGFLKMCRSHSEVLCACNCPTFYDLLTAIREQQTLEVYINKMYISIYAKLLELYFKLLLYSNPMEKVLRSRKNMGNYISLYSCSPIALRRS